MNIITGMIDFLIHVDKYLIYIIQNYGIWTYPILFLIIFVETGLVIMPFLPGDSLLFVAGAIAAIGSLNIFIIFILLSLAAILGDSLNYSIGKYLGDKIKNHKWIKKEYLHKTEDFYKRHGAKTIILARFAPFLRTFAPFVAGIGKMKYSKFLTYNIIGGVAWVGLFTFAGYFFGNLPFVQKNLTIIVLVIVVVSLIPAALEIIRSRKR